MTDAITPISPTVRGFMGRSCRSPAASTVCKSTMFVESREMDSRLNQQTCTCMLEYYLIGNMLQLSLSSAVVTLRQIQLSNLYAHPA